MPEILSRDGLARLLKWTAKDHTLLTPNILFLDAPGVPRFERGEGFLSAAFPKEGAFSLTSGGSWFLEGAASAKGADAIPPFPNIPAGLEGVPGEAYAASLESFRTFGSKVIGVPGVHPPDLRHTGAEVLVFGSALELSFQPRRLAQELVELKNAASNGQAIYAPGLGEPGQIALLSYCGIDMFDSSPLLAAARKGVRLFPSWKANAQETGICHCPACEMLDAGDGRRETGDGTNGYRVPGTGDRVRARPGVASARRTWTECNGPPGTTDDDESSRNPDPGPRNSSPGSRLPSPALTYIHNCYASLAEAATVRAAIRQGRLRELVEQRLSEPWLAAMLRHMDMRHARFCEMYFPVARPASSAGMLALGRAALHRPEARRFRERVLERCRRPPSAPVLLLLPCSARKPYSMSLSHRLFRSRVMRCGNPGAVHEVVVTSPLGVVPMEVESFYPAGSYDITVTGDWEEDEKKILFEQLRRFVIQGGYSHVVCHLSGMDFLKDALPASTVYTGGKRSTHPGSLEAMLSGLSDAVRDLPKVGGKLAGAERAASLCRFQFGDGGEALAAGCDLWRRGPELRFIMPDRQRTQVGMLDPERGLVSLTLPGGGRLAGRTGYEVAIDDFTPTGTVFAAGILNAGEAIRPGDEVVIAHDGRLRGVGAAVMGGPEMARSDRGAAVKVRHHVSAGGGGAQRGSTGGGGKKEGGGS